MTTTTTTTTTTQFLPLDQFVPDLQNVDFQGHLQLIDGIPINYILEKLHNLGPSYYNDKSTADTELHIKGYNKNPFFVHKEYLILQSNFFQKVFKNLTSGDVVTIGLPFPQNFEPILEYLYDGNDDKLYESLDADNYKKIWENVKYLGLGVKAVAVCEAFQEYSET
ncbi:uncharacterized protein OCT59_007464 [Rhizophagus irregularis]|uniref:BTB domain-containing protein n=2 Tax=Rhizophagus irregularis TaxID=588596 RepID=A0A015K8Z7_RHIIW|nr:hypothetical protein GLOIN_2v1525538 [Rhizophagus irregularis DAOM 181602=DAOM 197198]EXX55951.1 hypothetical protein RirG_220650 [Rhizophagus irregularis DAOM 197198w]UZO16068.1 hypothetical protein OCT59_007464 [Rhizophagus irregularis]POG79730.1 hypothetical protein GLOIN_2v1525538 [Rhizophagus irregularis DAOM 181602=DAOM 197198]CAB4478233.1 unnamed protein product [Rhizophagus irregularis]CAB5211238.1 unnamed protein product [Rhizophagus irregularis]|eukprot:XP_025186596.1 hypothetical protein GLOIN_2v1525538 [Rhizophagus irregularis DAOM 181602=DAOM 197198]